MIFVGPFLDPQIEWCGHPGEIGFLGIWHLEPGQLGQRAEVRAYFVRAEVRVYIRRRLY